MNAPLDDVTVFNGKAGDHGQPDIENYLQYQKEKKPILNGNYEYECIPPENRSPYPQEEVQPYKEEELYAVDLRTHKSIENLMSPNNIFQVKKEKKEVASIAQFLENFSCTDSCRNKNSSSKLHLENEIPSLKNDCIALDCCGCEENCDPVVATDYSMHHQSYYENSYTSKNLDFNNQNILSAATNTDSIEMVNRESQTREIQTKDASVQTNLEPKILGYMSKTPSGGNIKYICSMCRRVYTIKSSYDRHLRTHIKNTNRNVFTNVRFTTEAKLQVYKRHATKNNFTQGPIVIQMPCNSNIQCSLCEKFFSSQIEKDAHDCIIEPFPMTKCPECNVKFYTLGALNDHIGHVHKKDTPANSSYYCIFCDESVDAGYNFHLHLDKHLSQ